MFEAQTETHFEFVVQVQYHTGQKKTKTNLIAIRTNRLNRASATSLLKNILTVAPSSIFPPFIISKQDSKTTLEYYYVYQTAFELLVLKCFQKISHRLVHTIHLHLLHFLHAGCHAFSLGFNLIQSPPELLVPVPIFSIVQFVFPFALIFFSFQV